MKNYYYNMNDRMFEFDSTGDFPQVEYVRTGINIDYSYRIKEDGILRVKDYNDNITEYEVKKNDVVFLMYSNTDNYRDKSIIIIRDKQFEDYFKRLDETKEAMEKNSISNCDCDGCCCCEKVSTCG